MEEVCKFLKHNHEVRMQLMMTLLEKPDTCNVGLQTH